MLFLINLDPAVERQQRMMRQLAAANLEAHRVEVDLPEHDGEELRDQLAMRFPRLQFDLRRLGRAEARCWASHLTAWLKLLESCEPAATVIEDDVLLSQAFREALRTLHACNSFDVVYLGPTGSGVAGWRRQAAEELTVHATRGRLLHHRAYAIRRDFAERFFAQRKAVVGIPFDHFLAGRSDWAKPSIGVLHPTVIWSDRRLARQSTFRRKRNRWLWSLLGGWAPGRTLTVEGDRLSHKIQQTLT